MGPYPNNFLVVCICCICILIFHSIYSPTHKYCFCGGGGGEGGWGLRIFCTLELGDFPYSEDLISFLGRGSWAIFFHKAINDQSCNLNNRWCQNYLFHVFMLTFLTFTWEFSLWECSLCSSVHWNSQRCVYYCLVVTLWKCEYCLIWPLNKSMLFGSNSLKVWVLCGMNSEKSFYYSLIWKKLSENVNIAWYKLWKSV